MSISTLRACYLLVSSMGLLVGKPLVSSFLFSWGAVKRVSLSYLKVSTYGTSSRYLCCGIGFTMSIFISSLAFGPTNADFDTLARLGILMGSTTAAILGYFLLNLFFTENQAPSKTFNR
ncbi:Na+/H+ antiporter NhaA [Vibrio chagasii]|nr:Na+/H+ antiporter NhaA [Vibrio chagasii]